MITINKDRFNNLALISKELANSIHREIFDENNNEFDKYLVNGQGMHVDLIEAPGCIQK